MKRDMIMLQGNQEFLFIFRRICYSMLDYNLQSKTSVILGHVQSALLNATATHTIFEIKIILVYRLSRVLINQ